MKVYFYNDEYIKRKDAIDAITYVGTDKPTDIVPLTLYVAQRKIRQLPSADVVSRAELDTIRSLITHKEEEAYNKGYADAKADILEKLQADIERDEILAEYGDEFFEGRIAGFKVVMNYILSEGEG